MLEQLVGRFDPSAFDAPAGRARLRLAVEDVGHWDFVVNGSVRGLEAVERGRAIRAGRTSCSCAGWAAPKGSFLPTVEEFARRFVPVGGARAGRRSASTSSCARI